MQHGGTLVTKYDPKFVSHIVSNTASTSVALKALGLKSLDGIPDHIPTLAWSWVTTGFSGKLAHEVMHVAFGRFDADSGKAAAHMDGRKKARIASDEQDQSMIECAIL